MTAETLEGLLDALPGELARQALTHASWVDRRASSYERLAFLGDSVLGLAITDHLFPRLAADRYGAGRLTQIRAQAVSGRACAQVAERLGVPERLRDTAPADTGQNAGALAVTERVLASVTEAIIGACYLSFGFERTASAVVATFAREIEEALDHRVDFKSALQEQLARRGDTVTYAVVEESGPPHERRFAVSARVGGDEIGHGSGRSKKEAEQAAAHAALTALES